MTLELKASQSLKRTGIYKSICDGGRIEVMTGIIVKMF